MSVTVSFNGNSYSIPQDGEEGWSSLTNYLVALASASSSQSMQQSIKTVTTSYSVASTDFGVYVNAGSAATVSLPQGTTIGRLLFIADKSGLAATNNITIQATSVPSQVINAVNTYVINSNYGGVLLQWNGLFWQVISSFEGDIITANKSIVSGRPNPSTGISVADGQTCTAECPQGSIEFIVSLSDGRSFHCVTSYNSAGITAISDVDSLFLTADSGTGIYINKSATSGTINFKSRLGSTLAISIIFINNAVISTTDWA